jgi:hypothetical protein
LGEVLHVDQLLITVPNEFALQPFLVGEGNYVEISTDLQNWERLTYLAGKKMTIEIAKQVRYLRFKEFPQQITEIEGTVSGRKLDRSNWRASNLFAHPDKKEIQKVWKTTVKLDEVSKGSYLCVAINGKHGIEGAYAAAKIDGKFVGAPDRASSFQSNTWEYVNARKDKNYTYYIPVDESVIGKDIEVFVMGYDKENLDLNPVLWISAYPHPFEKIKLVLEK